MRLLTLVTTILLLVAATAVAAADREDVRPGGPAADRAHGHADAPQHGARAGERRGGVPPGYRAADRRIARAGRAATRLLRAGDVAALHRRFTPALADEVPPAALRALIEELTAVAPIGPRLGDTRLPLGPGLRGYSADHRHGDRVLDVDLVFDRSGAIATLTVGVRRPLPPDPADRAVMLRFPLRGTWWVYWGGPDERRNYHVVEPAQRHAVDLVRWQRGGTARGDGARNADYHAWDEPVLAPADGVVTAAVDGVADNRPRVELVDERQPAGNHVVLDLGDGAYALLGHLRRGSVAVRVGDRVRAGAPLGRVGNSGNSSEPHLHLHVQDGPDPEATAGLPMRFAQLRVDGRPPAAAPALQGRFVARAR